MRRRLHAALYALAMIAATLVGLAATALHFYLWAFIVMSAPGEGAAAMVPIVGMVLALSLGTWATAKILWAVVAGARPDPDAPRLHGPREYRDAAAGR